MKRKYQGVIVLNLQGNEDSLDDIIGGIEKELEDEGATMEQIDRVGRKDFAHENHAKQKNGFYVNYVFQAEPSAIDKIQTRLALSKDIQLQYYQIQKPAPANRSSSGQ
jgi:small subunit ribosomal protein S6